ncbi:Phage integrase family protein [Novipirellula aureliae]|uniref:Phage integrase family protein n=1 Tax=Novipirellula aureliae TaxID=2527966 RepID=A0A5C6DZN7_9BACT|nr:tyrosine-type recombinase/integrase [Novipirellula aureliae]TWU41674.1 Phage integrase family protein [Novipirellula aureliae]
MSRRLGKVPAYCHHKASGRAVVRIFGKDVYLGPYGAPESHEAYEAEIARWRAATNEGESLEHEIRANSRFDLTLAEVLLRYKAFAENYYVKDGKPTKELTEMQLALRPARVLFGDTLARDFGPLSLKAVREAMINSDLSRGVINNRTNRIKRFIKWAASEQLVPPSVYEGVRTVTGLKFGRTRARETDPIKPVEDEHIEPVLAAVSSQVAAMIRLQRLTGMRPCEVVLMQFQDIERSKDIWIYEPQEHKTQWRGHHRVIALGPQCQEILTPFLILRQHGFLFSPRDAEEYRNGKRRENRQSPMTPSQQKRKPKKNPKKAKRDYYDVASYRRAIKYGILKVNKQRKVEKKELLPNWFPLQLRHSRATEINELYGIEAAAVSLGHSHADVTRVYAERNLKLAIEVARKVG